MAKTLLPHDFSITDAMRQWARWKVPGLDLEDVTSEFVDHARGKGWLMVDWVATWRNWMKRAHREGKHKMRPLPAAAPRPTDAEEIDVWEAAGNAHLLKHIRHRMGKGPRRYGDPGIILWGQYLKQPSEEFRENVGRLVHAMRSWVRDMRDLAQNGGVPVKTQQDIWRDYISAAERPQ